LIQKINIPDSVIGLTDIEVKASREKFGNNEQIHKQKNRWWLAL
jgi:Ca2+-transporting ATPase